MTRTSPWQKGGIEHAIGRLRRTLPRQTDLAPLSAQRFYRFVHAYTHTPRKCLGYATPAEVFIHQVLHLKCESTSLDLSIEGEQAEQSGQVTSSSVSIRLGWQW